jgi:hypothetical protein
MFKYLLVFILLFSFFGDPFFAQQKDTIILMNGNIVTEKVIDTLIGAVTIKNPKHPQKNIHYEYDELFCVHYANGFKDYYYTQDTLKGNWFTRDEMFMFTKGEADGRKGFTANGSMITAGLLGIASGCTGTFFGPLLPYGYLALCGIPKVRIRHNTISNPNYIDSDGYILGYERSARYRRRLKSLLGGTVGLAIGYAAYFIVLKSLFEGTSPIQFK